MLERIMKPFGAAAVFLAVINLLTVSSSSANVTDPTSSQTSGVQDSSTALASTPLVPKSPTEPDQKSPTIVPSLPITTQDASSTRTSRSISVSTLSSPTETTPRVHTTDGSNTDLNSSTVASEKMSSAPPKDENPVVDAETTTPSIKVSSKEAVTKPIGETQTNPTINDKDSKKQNESSGGSKQMSATSNKGIKIGAGCVAAVIAVIVLVVIYKICQKKPSATGNVEEKPSAETKENVKLLSVKTETPNSDTKRTSSNQMECIEC